MPIKSYRGKIADGAVDKVQIHSKTGAIGYRIKKLQIIHAEPGQQEAEHTVKIYSIKQTTATNTIDFNDQTLLGVAYLKDHDGVAYPGTEMIIFDNMTFNQDIFITHEDTNGSYPCNYYLELEQIKLSLNENTVATLKDIRNIRA